MYSSGNVMKSVRLQFSNTFTLNPGILYIYIYIDILNLASVVGIATSYWLDDTGVGVRVPVAARIFSSPRRPDRLWSPPNLLSNGYRGLLSQW
jgi:hypothetical protein